MATPQDAIKINEKSKTNQQVDPNRALFTEPSETLTSSSFSFSNI